jgi:hypothetical protein
MPPRTEAEDGGVSLTIRYADRVDFSADDHGSSDNNAYFSNDSAKVLDCRWSSSTYVRDPALHGLFFEQVSRENFNTSLFGRFILRTIGWLWKWQSSIARSLQPGIHRNAHFRDRLLGRASESRARFEIRDIGNPSRILVRPEHDNGIAVHGSVFEREVELPYHIPKLAHLIRLCIFSNWLDAKWPR